MDKKLKDIMDELCATYPGHIPTSNCGRIEAADLIEIGFTACYKAMVESDDIFECHGCFAVAHEVCPVHNSEMASKAFDPHAGESVCKHLNIDPIDCHPQCSGPAHHPECKNFPLELSDRGSDDKE